MADQQSDRLHNLFPSPEEMEESRRRAIEEVEREHSPELHAPLPADLEDIVESTHVRIAGCGTNGDFLGEEQLQKDAAAIVVMNNVLALDPGRLSTALENDGTGGEDILRKYAKSGWHATTISEDTVKSVLDAGGYTFLVEHLSDSSSTPFGYQLGFPSRPPPVFPSLAPQSLPHITTFTRYVDDTWTIWRTGVVNTIEDVRLEFHKLGIPISPELSSKKLHRLGAGQATKLVVGRAAHDLKKKFIQFNIGKIVRPDHPEDILMENEASRGSNGEIFDETGLNRTRADSITAPDGKTLLLEILWRMFRSETNNVLARLLRPSGVLRVKKWNNRQLLEAGAHLSKDIQRRAATRST